MSSDDMEIRVRLSGARAAAGEMKGLKAEVVGTGAATDRAGRKSRQAGKAFGTLRGKVGALTASYRSAAKGILAAGAAFASYEGLKSSVDTTVKLGKTTIGLTKNLGLTTKAASEWAAVAETRGVDTKALNMSFGTLSKSIEAAHKPTTKQAAYFRKLGVEQKALQGNDFNKILGETADGLERLGAGHKRTAATMALFGRGWQTIVPLLRDGSKGMKEQLQLADKYGVTFHGKTIKSVQDFISAQREAKLATMGLQVSIGTTLIPMLTKVVGAFSKFVYQVRSGTGAGGRFRDKVEQIWKAAKPVVFWFGRAAKNVFKFASSHPNLVKVATALLLASKALKLMRFGSAITGALNLWGALGKAERRATAMPGKVASTGSKWGGAGKLVGGLFAAAFIAEAWPSISDWINKVTGGGLSPNDLPITRKQAGHVVGHFTRDGIRYETRQSGGMYGPRHNFPTAEVDTGRPGVNPQRSVDRGPRGVNPPRYQHHGPGSRPKLALEGDTVVHTVVMLGDRPVWEAWERHNRRKANRK